MKNQVRLILEEKCQLLPDETLLVGFSGGTDSLALLHMLKELGYTVVAGHFDHGLRAESKADAQKAAILAAQVEVPFIEGRGDVLSARIDRGGGVEETARDLRYRFLFKQAEKIGAKAVVVGHTANDQAETVLMHILRGAGPDGLKGMVFRSELLQYHPSIPVIRPILNTWRVELEAYCQAHGLVPIEDRSNEDTRFLRNQVRHELIPYLEGYSPNISSSLAALAQMMQDDAEVIELFVEQHLSLCVKEQGPGYIGLYRRQFTAVPPALHTRLLRRAAHLALGSLEDFDASATFRALRWLLAKQTTGRVDLVHGHYALLEGEVFWIVREAAHLPSGPHPQLSSDHQLKLLVPGVIPISTLWDLQASIVSSHHEQAKQKNLGEGRIVRVDLGCLEGELLVRKRRPGDRFYPLGMPDQSIKLSDWMINKKIPARLRRDYPLVCAGDMIVWIPGYQIAHVVRVTDKTETILELELIPTL